VYICICQTQIIEYIRGSTGVVFDSRQNGKTLIEMVRTFFKERGYSESNVIEEDRKKDGWMRCD